MTLNHLYVILTILPVSFQITSSYNDECVEVFDPYNNATN